jgi:hypothetical protein
VQGDALLAQEHVDSVGAAAAYNAACLALRSRALCCLKLGKVAEACADAELAVQLRRTLTLAAAARRAVAARADVVLEDHAMIQARIESVAREAAAKTVKEIAQQQKEAQAAIAKKEAQAAVMDITGLPGMAETAGIFAHSSALQGMSVAEAVQATITHLWVWDWATPAALAKREAAEQKAQADAAQKEAVMTFTAITGRPGMAEVAGWHAHDAVTIKKMSVADAVQEAITRMNMWTWATPAARAKRAQEEQEQDEHDPVLERLIAESRAIREAPLSAFAAEAGLEDEEEIETPPVPARHYQTDALEQFEDAAAWDRF